MNILKPHVSLNVSNIDASVAFYEKVFGVAATKRRPGGGVRREGRGGSHAGRPDEEGLLRAACPAGERGVSRELLDARFTGARERDRQVERALARARASARA